MLLAWDAEEGSDRTDNSNTEAVMKDQFYAEGRSIVRRSQDDTCLQVARVDAFYPMAHETALEIAAVLNGAGSREGALRSIADLARGCTPEQAWDVVSRLGRLAQEGLAGLHPASARTNPFLGTRDFANEPDETDTRITVEQARAAVVELSRAAAGYSIYRNYSGRAMYGRTAVGVTGPSRDAILLALMRSSPGLSVAQADQLRHDQLGRDCIVY